MPLDKSLVKSAGQIVLETYHTVLGVRDSEIGHWLSGRHRVCFGVKGETFQSYFSFQPLFLKIFSQIFHVHKEPAAPIRSFFIEIRGTVEKLVQVHNV